MTESTAPQVVRSYLTQLQKALADLPGEVSEEIVAGIREELDGLDASAAAARIETLGDPEFIAAEAHSEAVGSPLVEPVETTAAEPRWLAVLAALLVAFGGVIVPVIGWVVGIALVWMSKTWRRWEKWVGTLIAPGVAVLAALIPFIIAAFEAPPPAHEAPNPLIPGYYDPFAILIVGPALFGVVAGIWLLWRARRVWSSADRTQPGREPANAQPRQQGSGYPVVTVLLLILGGVVVPVLGWAVGVAMLWAADVWSIRDKWLGTLAGPVAILAAGLAMFIVRIGGGGSSGLVWWHAVLLGGVALPVIANLLVGIRLLRRSR